MERPKCRHCHTRLVTRPRRLCHACYYTPGVIDLYPPACFYGRCGTRGRAAAQYTATESQPTTAMPGTSEKLAVLTARATAGQELFHAADARPVVAPSPPRWRVPVCSVVLIPDPPNEDD